MQFQIKKVIIWPKKVDFGPRIVSFRENSVNVITGESRTGKSAVIPIIDYCLGASKCAIPVDTIRNACCWFGVLAQVEGAEWLFARKGPDQHESTGEMFVESGASVSIPDVIASGNTTADAMKQSLNELAGLTDLPMAQRTEGFIKGSRPSFRDLVSFVFQPQNVVANSDVLFFKTGQTEYRQRLKQIFPYALGSINAQTLVLMHQHVELEKELKRKELELKTVTAVSVRWRGEVASLLDQAVKYGLLHADIPLPGSWAEQVRLLKDVAATAIEESNATAVSNITETARRLRELHNREAAVSYQVGTLQSRLSSMATLGDSIGQYLGSLQTRSDRLALSDWLAERVAPDRPCPFCGETSERAKQELQLLAESARRYGHEAAKLAKVPPIMDRERLAVTEQLKALTEELAVIQRRRRDLEQSSEAARHAAYTSKERYRFVGALQEGLKTYQEIGVDAGLVAEVNALKERVSALRSQIHAADEKERTKRALQQVNSNAGRIITGLDSEWPNAPIEVMIDDLTVRITKMQRHDYLWEMGSGSNWLSYHIAATLALHQHFLNTPRCPVPSFQIYDQPSQVYFPKTPPSGNGSTETGEHVGKDVDIEAVRKIFATLSAFLTGIHPIGFQIIVMDHAPTHLWANLENVNTVEEWIGGRSLVPTEWLAGEGAAGS